jgi:6-phosphogluconate dehydrogenase
MEMGIVGLGRMGANIARRLSRGGHRVLAYNRTMEKTAELGRQEHNVAVMKSLKEMATYMAAPRSVWLMVPAGDATEEMIDDALKNFAKGDTIIDGGNSYYKDTIRRTGKVRAKGLNFVDVGTSGGVWGLAEGFSMMVGGDQETVKRLRPIFETLAPAPDKGWGHVGPNGAGHYAKMVHNGIEYGMMESLAEGFEVLKSKTDFKLDLHQVAEIWRHGSVVRSWLLDLLADALSGDQNLPHIKGWVADSGEGRWTVAEAIEHDVPAPVLTLALLRRFVSRQEESYSAKLLAAMRKEFGGHEVKPE